MICCTLTKTNVVSHRIFFCTDTDMSSTGIYAPFGRAMWLATCTPAMLYICALLPFICNCRTCWQC
jgi:hypothetical protein